MKTNKHIRPRVWVSTPGSPCWLTQEPGVDCFCYLCQTQDSVIQIDLTNKSIPHAYNGQLHIYEEFNKTGINQVKQHNMIITKAPILKY